MFSSSCANFFVKSWKRRSIDWIWVYLYGSLLDGLENAFLVRLILEMNPWEVVFCCVKNFDRCIKYSRRYFIFYNISIMEDKMSEWWPLYIAHITMPTIQINFKLEIIWIFNSSEIMDRKFCASCKLVNAPGSQCFSLEFQQMYHLWWIASTHTNTSHDSGTKTVLQIFAW